ncbi:hypothetical protein SK128_001404, partial [Halocaridina rubra]
LDSDYLGPHRKFVPGFIFMDWLDTILADNDKMPKTENIPPEVMPEKAFQDGKVDEFPDSIFNELLNGHNVSDLEFSDNVPVLESRSSKGNVDPIGCSPQNNPSEDQFLQKLFCSPQISGSQDDLPKMKNDTTSVVPVIVSYELYGQPVMIPIPEHGTPNPQTSSSRKRKLYEEDEFSDPELEKKRQNAMNARNHREKTKKTIQDLKDKLLGVEEEREKYRKENKKLRQENEDLKGKYKALLFLLN